MRKGWYQEVRLVVTIALKKEAPVEWLTSRNVPVRTLAALQSGRGGTMDSGFPGILFVVTGAGPESSRRAALWIMENLEPLYVLNIGTSGVLHSGVPLGEWLRPHAVVNEKGEWIDIDTRLPMPCGRDIIESGSLLTVNEATLGDVPDLWRSNDLVDMECYAQAEVFRGTDVSFHCLKLGSDYSDHHARDDFNRNLEMFKHMTQELMEFIQKKDDPPNVSVIIPVYNRERLIQRALDSVLDQSSLPDEVIVVDDGSTDRTREVLERYNDRITVVSLPENSGPARARNEGVRYARNDWIAFLDSDDAWDTDKLSRQVAYLQRYPFYEIVQSDEKWIRNDVQVNQCNHHRKSAGWIFDRSLERCMISPSAVLVKKSLLIRYGNFDESYPVCEDYDLWLKISRYHPIGFVPGFSVVKYGGHGDQLSRSYAAVDRFRVSTLKSLLEIEHVPEFSEKIAAVLEKKLKILLKGYEKRQKDKEAIECREMLARL